MCVMIIPNELTKYTRAPPCPPQISLPSRVLREIWGGCPEGTGGAGMIYSLPSAESFRKDVTTSGSNCLPDLSFR